MNKKRGLKYIEKRYNLPEQKIFVDFLRNKINSKKLYENVPDIKLTKIEHWFRYDEIGFSYPSVDDWNKVKYLLDDDSDTFNIINDGLTNVEYELDDINKNGHLGRLKRCVWSINTKPSKEKHFATYPEELIITPILSSTDENDVVYDPFIGSGTTAIVSLKFKRNYIGSEISEEYTKIANNRINNFLFGK
jgi:DNA modification methylase